ncbi:hypothetical protein F2P81_013464 [Scophthalmus maximus]|uniref:GDNF/GAS1 domain-containing protein n=1 Tax=Scophthalmus maximus TaxID=52904 RepID=A0A6A4SML0_SCOMX|nr:hypothetical protein F2P81_013464 [Scophthalmus maximus]
MQFYGVIKTAYRLNMLSDWVFVPVSSRQRCPQANGLESVAPLVRSVEETPDPIPTTIKGTVPAWINGSFLRNGPGKFEFGKDRYTHWFDGMAMMHRFHICDGNVTYSSRFLQSDSYVCNSEKNRIVVSEFGTLAMPDPCKNIFARFFSRFQIPKATDNASVHFVKYKGDYYVSTETNYMRRVDPQSLETKEKVDWSQYIAVNSATAHPHYDREGATYNMGNSYGKSGFFYNIIRVPPPEDNVASEDSADLTGAKVICSIRAAEPRKPSYYHSFVMSENYIVFIEQPIKLDLLKFMLYRIQGKSFHKVMTWEPQYNTIFHLVDRHTGKESEVRYFTAPMFTLHQINAFEDNGFLVMDMCCGDDGEVIGDFTLENLRRGPGEDMDKFYNSLCRNFPRRYVLPLNVDEKTPLDQNLVTLHNYKASAKKTKPGEVYMTHEELHDDELLQYGGLEFPQINYERYNGRPYRYFYSCGFGHVFSDSLLKMDVHTKELKLNEDIDFLQSRRVELTPRAVEIHRLFGTPNSSVSPRSSNMKSVTVWMCVYVSLLLLDDEASSWEGPSALSVSLSTSAPASPGTGSQPEWVDCIQASDMCNQNPYCSSRYRVMRQCLVGKEKEAMLDNNRECQAALEVLLVSPLYDCRCKRGMKKELQCLQNYWTIHMGLTEGGDMDDSSPYEPVAPNRHPDAFRLASISSAFVNQSMRPLVHLSVHSVQSIPLSPLNVEYNSQQGMLTVASKGFHCPDAERNCNHCLDAAKACNLNNSCKKQRSTYIATCSKEDPNKGETCSKKRCHKALRMFLDRVPTEFSHRLLFCPCQTEGCAERRRQTIVPDCSYKEKEKPNCLELRRVCRQDSLCRSRLADYLANCWMTPHTVSTCPNQDNHQACLASYARLIGNAIQAFGYGIDNMQNKSMSVPGPSAMTKTGWDWSTGTSEPPFVAIPKVK